MQDDLFGHVPQQGELLDAPTGGPRKAIYSEIYGWIEPPPVGGHTPDTIRAKMLRLIGEARAATTMPWNPRMVHSHTVMFPYFAEWLPREEGEQLLLEFAAEMERLKLAA